MGVEGFTIFGIPVVVTMHDVIGLVVGAVLFVVLLVVFIFNELFLVAFRWWNKRGRKRSTD